MTQPFTSVIVLNYNGLRHLETVLRSLENQNLAREEYEIILADNGSSDGSVEYVHKEFPRVRTIVFSKNHGFAEGNNLAAREASGSFLAFLNNDTEADPNWLGELVRIHQQYPEAILGSQAFQFERRQESANSVAKLMAWGIPTNVNVYRPRQELSMEIQETLYPDAAGMGITKQLFLDLGGFDPSYFAYEEEKDLGWKAWLRGYRSLVVPTSIYYHKGGATLGQYSRPAIALLWRNGLRNLVKYPSGWRLVTMLPLHMAFSLGTYVAIFIPLKRWSLGWAMLMGYFNLFRDLPQLLRVRKSIQKNRVISDRNLQERGLLLGFWASWQHSRNFLQRRRSR